MERVTVHLDPCPCGGAHGPDAPCLKAEVGPTDWEAYATCPYCERVDYRHPDALDEDGDRTELACQGCGRRFVVELQVVDLYRSFPLELMQ